MGLTMRMLLFVAMVVCGTARAAQPVWVSDEQRLYQVSAEVGLVTRTVDEPGVVGLAADRQGGVWALSAHKLAHIQAVGGTANIEIPLSRLEIAAARSIRLDPFDDAVWVSDGDRLVHVSLDGRVSSPVLIQEPLADWAVGMERTLWLLGSKSLRQYGRFESDGGRLLTSHGLDGLETPPTLLAIDALHGRAWLSGGKTLSVIDLRGNLARIDVDIPEPVLALSVDQRTGTSWALSKTGLTAFAPSASGQIVATPWPAGELIFERPITFALDPSGKTIWLAQASGLSRVDVATRRSQPIRATGGETLTVLSSPAFFVAPTLVLLSPKPPATLSGGEELVFGLGARCPDGPCTPDLSYFSGFGVEGTLGPLRLAQASIDPVARQASVLVPNVQTHGRPVTLVARAMDAFGHASNVVTEHFEPKPNQTVGQVASSARRVAATLLPATADGPFIGAGSTMPEGAAAPPLPADAGDVVSGELASTTRRPRMRPVALELNQGQHHRDVKFYAKAPAGDAYLTKGSLVLGLRGKRSQPHSNTPSAENSPLLAQQGAPQASATTAAVQVSFVGANREPEVEGLDRLTSYSSYFVGSDRRQWRTRVPHYARARFKNLYPGIDAIYSGESGSLEYDFVVAPGADPGVIRQQVNGAEAIALTADERLAVRTSAGEVFLSKPLIYQVSPTAPGRRVVEGGFVVREGQQFGFWVGAYDKSLPLVIDPVVIFSAPVAAQRISVDANSNIYLAGVSFFDGIPGGPLTNFGTSQNLLIQKLSADGNTVLWNAFLGGNSSGTTYDTLVGLAVDAAGSAYITGNTPNADFPTTPGAFQAAKRSPNSYGNGAAFVSKLSPTGDSLVYSTFLSGSNNETANGIALDGAGNAYITGHTNSSDFPRTAGNYRTFGGSGFLVKLNASGSALTYADVMGGLEVSAPTVDGAGNAYIVGVGQLGALPITGTGYHGAPPSASAYVMRLNASGTQISAIASLGNVSYCSLSASWTGRDAQGAVYLGGQSGSCPAEYLGVEPALLPFPPPDGRAPFVAKFSSDLSGLAYLFFVGSSGDNLSNAFAVDSGGSVYVAGSNYRQADFPYFNVIPGTPATVPPAGPYYPPVPQYLTKINPEGKGLVFASSLSADNPFIRDLTVDAAGALYAASFDGVYKVAAPETLAVSLSSSKRSLLAGKTLTLTARVSGGSAPTGSVDFLDGSTLIGNVPLASGVVAFSTNSLSAGTHNLTARYRGDASNAATVSQAVEQYVFEPAPSTTSLSVNATTASVGSAVVFQAYVSESLQNGTVLDQSLPRTLVLREGSTVLATIANPSRGRLSTFTLNDLPVGTHTVVAYYSGSEEVLPSQSDPVTVTVIPLTPPIASIELSAPQGLRTPPADYSVTVNASPTGSAAIQSVHLTEAFGPTTLFSGPLAGPPYVYPVAGKLEGAYQYTAVVTDSNGLSTTVSTSAMVHQPPALSITSPLANAVIQAPLNLTLTARANFFDPQPYARGPGNDYQITRMEFVEGLVTYPASVPIGTLGLNVDINATLDAVPPGTHTVRARVADGYGGETLSEPITFTVNPAPGAPALAASWVAVSSGQTVPAPFELIVAFTAPPGSVGAETLFQLYEGSTLLQQQRVYLGARWRFGVYATPGVHHYRAVVSNGSVSASTPVLSLNVVAGQAGPTLSMGGPLDGASFAAGSSITFPVEAKAGTNGLQRIDLYQGTTLIGSSAGPVNFEWANVPAGEYLVTAVATDNAGFRTQTAPVRISVGAALTVALTAPADRAQFVAPASFSLTANAAALAGGSVARVEFYQGATLVGTATSPPYSVAFSSPTDGAYIFTAKGYTASGGSAVSAPVQVLVQTPASPGVPNDSVVYLHTDVAGTPIAATDQSGAVVWRESYKPFGERHVHPAADAGTRQYFHGKSVDAESGLSYFGARHFDPLAGRFMGTDSVLFHEENLHSFNRYAYGNNNPYLYRDPDGRLPILIPIALYVFGNAAIGAGFDYSIQRAMGKDVNWSQVALSGAISGILGGEAGAVTGTAFTGVRVSGHAAAQETATLYRAVTQAELNQIQRTG